MPLLCVMSSAKCTRGDGYSGWLSWKAGWKKGVRGFVAGEIRVLV